MSAHCHLLIYVKCKKALLDPLSSFQSMQRLMTRGAFSDIHRLYSDKCRGVSGARLLGKEPRDRPKRGTDIFDGQIGQSETPVPFPIGGGDFSAVKSVLR